MERTASTLHPTPFSQPGRLSCAKTIPESREAARSGPGAATMRLHKHMGAEIEQHCPRATLLLSQHLQSKLLFPLQPNFSFMFVKIKQNRVVADLLLCGLQCQNLIFFLGPSFTSRHKRIYYCLCTPCIKHQQNCVIDLRILENLNWDTWVRSSQLALPKAVVGFLLNHVSNF